MQATVKSEERRLRPDASEVLMLQSGNALAKELLGWSPQTNLEDGLRRTAEWLKAHLGLYNASFFHV